MKKKTSCLDSSLSFASWRLFRGRNLSNLGFCSSPSGNRRDKLPEVHLRRDRDGLRAVSPKRPSGVHGFLWRGFKQRRSGDCGGFAGRLSNAAFYRGKELSMGGKPDLFAGWEYPDRQRDQGAAVERYRFDPGGFDHRRDFCRGSGGISLQRAGSLSKGRRNFKSYFSDMGERPFPLRKEPDFFMSSIPFPPCPRMERSFSIPPRCTVLFPLLSKPGTRPRFCGLLPASGERT